MKGRMFVAVLLLISPAAAQTDAGNKVRAKNSNELENDYVTPASALVSVDDLGVPLRARKELDRANELLVQRDYSQAMRRLNQAISIYPAYAVAYNNLGVIYARIGDPVRSREALQKAISLNDHFALGYVNIGKMNIAAGDFPDAESTLVKASGLDPADPVPLMLLSYAEYMNRRFDEAIANTRKAHAMRKPHSFAHRVAARVFEQERQGASAIAELEIFLSEEPTGPRADAARKELEIVKAFFNPPQIASKNTPTLTEPAP
jgi:Flp pilus assembly protein TadD